MALDYLLFTFRKAKIKFLRICLLIYTFKFLKHRYCELPELKIHKEKKMSTLEAHLSALEEKTDQFSNCLKLWSDFFFKKLIFTIAKPNKQHKTQLFPGFGRSLLWDHRELELRLPYFHSSSMFLYLNDWITFNDWMGQKQF